ncbi:MAG: zinc-dependent metalloprotease family protein [Saprospiraceae bacterium]
MRHLLIIAAFLSFNSSIFAQNIWTSIPSESVKLDVNKAWPGYFQGYQLNRAELEKVLDQAPLEGSIASAQSVLLLPNPEGRMLRFQVWYSPIMPAKLAAKYPNIRSWIVSAIDNPELSGRIDLSVQGFYAMINSPSRTYYIDPAQPMNLASQYLIYERKAFQPDRNLYPNPPMCGTETAQSTKIATDNLKSRSQGEPVVLHTYVAAIACTGEWAVFNGGTLESAMAAIVTAINRTNAVMEKEVAVRLVLVDNNDTLISLNGNLDPFTNGLGKTMIDQNPGWIGSRVPNSIYDIGHVFGTNGVDVGGVAQSPSVCTTSKARGVTFQYTNNGSLDPFIATICHEMGHQFDCAHTFSKCGLTDQLASGNGYEPGSGSTIMAYPGACGADNVAFENSLYYHNTSIQQFINYSRNFGGNSCAETSATNNTEPIITQLPDMTGKYIPINTPFQLEGQAIDPDGDPLFYCWEQFDLGDKSTPLAMPEGNCPIFRSFDPVTSNRRYFPRLGVILSGIFDLTEQLPTYSRDLHFQMTVRDSRDGGGGTVWDLVGFKATELAGPFVVQSQNTPGIVYQGGDWVEVNWDVANTDRSPVECRNVDIILSKDGGQTYTDTLLRKVLNDGSAYVLMPNVAVNAARLQVIASDNIFFDINDVNFKITPSTIAKYSLTVSPQDISVCLPNTADITLDAISILGYDKAVELEVIDGLPDGATYLFTKNPVLPGESTVLTLNIPDWNISGVYTLKLRALSENQDTQYRYVKVDFISNRFDDLKLQSPANGELAVGILPTFAWQPSSNATGYILEIATNPAFGPHVIYTASGITEPYHIPTSLILEKTIYYWRVLPVNRCGISFDVTPSAFQTKILSCEEVTKIDEIVISKQGTPTIGSVITIPYNGTVSDLNVSQITGYHDAFGDLQYRLVSPAADTLLLMKNKCGVTSFTFNMGFDDESPDAFVCPPNKNKDYKPLEPLTQFAGTETKGDWKLLITDTQPTSGGKLNSWSLRICSAGNSLNPTLAVNDTLPVHPNESALMTNGYLLTEDGQSLPEEIVYELVSVPQYGYISLYGTPLEIGQTFQQAHLSDVGAMRYHNTDPSAQYDGFNFIVKNQLNGWRGIEKFNIKMDALAAVHVETGNSFKMYPNPAAREFVIDWNRPDAIRSIQIFDASGKSQFKSNKLQGPISISSLNSGMYFVQIQTDKGLYVSKLIKLAE